MRLAWFALGLLASCSRQSPAPDASVPVASDPSTIARPAPPSSSTAEPVACPIAAGYRGHMLGLPVFARLAREGMRLSGRYFYESKGVDLALQGSLSDEGTLHLVEGDMAATTGRIEGRCEPANGTLTGEWVGARIRGQFHLAPIPPGETPVVAVKRFAVARRARLLGADPGIPECSYRESHLELFGLRDEGVERTLNRQGAEPLLGAVLDPALARGVSSCADGFFAERSEHLVGSFRELATFEGSGSIDGGGMHPNELDLRRFTVDLRTGRHVAADDVLVEGRDPLARVADCAAKATPFDTSIDAEEWRGHLDRSRIDLAEDGVHFFVDGFPHVTAALSGQGPVIGYDVLLRDGYLRTDSPVKRAWRGVRPAPRSKAWCPDMKVDAGWR
jgi:hypothetical protein